MGRHGFSNAAFFGEAFLANFGCRGSSGGYFLAAALAGGVVSLDKANLAVAEVAGFWRQLGIGMQQDCWGLFLPTLAVADLAEASFLVAALAGGRVSAEADFFSCSRWRVYGGRW